MFKKNYVVLAAFMLIGTLHLSLMDVQATEFICNSNQSDTSLPTETPTGDNHPVPFPCIVETQDKPVTDKTVITLLDEHVVALEEAKRTAIDDYLSGDMAGQIELFYDRAIELDIDPVFAVALAAWETGNGKSNICINKHNFGGMRGSGEYIRFESAEVGIESFLNLLVSYKEKGSDTPEKMASRYAADSTTWAGNVRKIMAKIDRSIEKKQKEVDTYYENLAKETEALAKTTK